MSKLLFAVLLLATLGLASAHVLYSRTAAPASWVKGARATPKSSIEFTLALKQRNLDILDQWFTEVSDPKHANYQDYKSIDEIKSLVSPKPAETEKVLSWLHATGVHHRNVVNNGDSLDIKTTAKVAEKLFNTQFFTYKHAETGALATRQFGAYSVPEELKDIVEMVVGISSFPIPHLTTQRENAANDGGVVPQTMFAQYQVSQASTGMLTQVARKLPKHLRAQGASTSQAVIEFEDQFFAPSDLQAFGQGVSESVQAVPSNQVIGTNDPTQPGTESTLDIEMVAGVNLGASNWFWIEGGSGWLYTFATHFFGTQSVPQVASISYGWWEGDQCEDGIGGQECQQLGVDSTGYVQRVNTEFQKIGTRGISLLVASGDSGANGRTDPDCSAPTLRPSFPASSPYVTAVGATEIVNNTQLSTQPPICAASGMPCVGAGAEEAVSYAISSFASGGGFSAIAAMPSYQKTAVNAYLNSGVALPPASYFNSTGRGFPDVAAVGHNLLITQGGMSQPVGGTSASSPIFTSIMALLNVAQISKTGKPLGFLNPFLYQMAADCPECFHDVTVGDNKCTEQGCSASCTGYLCAPGWDPVTGLGTPNYANMLQYVENGMKRL